MLKQTSRVVLLTIVWALILLAVFQLEYPHTQAKPFLSIVLISFGFALVCDRLADRILRVRGR